MFCSKNIRTLKKRPYKSSEAVALRIEQEQRLIRLREMTEELNQAKKEQDAYLKKHKVEIPRSCVKDKKMARQLYLEEKRLRMKQIRANRAAIKAATDLPMVQICATADLHDTNDMHPEQDMLVSDGPKRKNQPPSKKTTPAQKLKRRFKDATTGKKQDIKVIKKVLTEMADMCGENMAAMVKTFEIDARRIITAINKVTDAEEMADEIEAFVAGHRLLPLLRGNAGLRIRLS